MLWALAFHLHASLLVGFAFFATIGTVAVAIVLILQPPLDRPPQFAEAMARLKEELGQKVHESLLFKRAAWRGGPLQSAVGTPDDWPECQAPQALPAETRVADAVRHLRNGLAHGNVFSRSSRDGQIAELVFISGGTFKSGRTIPLRFLVLSPDELRQFLDRWFNFVAGLQLHGLCRRVRGIRAIAEWSLS